MSIGHWWTRTSGVQCTHYEDILSVVTRGTVHRESIVFILGLLVEISKVYS